MFKYLTKLLTKKYAEVPLFIIYLNYNKFKKEGKEKSCLVQLHPLFRKDQYLETELKKLIDYIRDNYNMDEII